MPRHYSSDDESESSSEEESEREDKKKPRKPQVDRIDKFKNQKQIIVNVSSK